MSTGSFANDTQVKWRRSRLCGQPLAGRLSNEENDETEEEEGE